jgi:hypothetical protein
MPYIFFETSGKVGNRTETTLIANDADLKAVIEFIGGDLWPYKH